MAGRAVNPKKVAKALKLHERNARKLHARGDTRGCQAELLDAKKIERILNCGGYDRNGKSTL